MKMAILFLLTLLVWPCLARGSHDYNIVDFGAKAGGETDSSSPALRKVWATACSSTKPSTIRIPSGRFLVASPVVFRGASSCKSKDITFRIHGVLVAPSDYKSISAAHTWLYFDDVVGVSIYGGTLDAQGESLWSCKKSSSQHHCPSGATTLGFTNSQDIVLNGVTSINSQLYHIVFNGCKNVQVKGVAVTASGESPNTDGIHVQGSTGVDILNTKISTGDDCVSIGPGTSNLLIKNIVCGPGHGISIGSLGKHSIEAGVQNVTVKSSMFRGSKNGLRIKSWARASTGFVKNILFQHVAMMKVQNPIIVDQHYCPDHKGCPTQDSGVSINGVKYQDVVGSSATQVAMKFDCSSKSPCKNIVLEDVSLTYQNRPALSSCNNVVGRVLGVVKPSGCLQ